MLMQDRENHRGNIVRPGSYTERIANIPSRSDGLLCIKCDNPIGIGSECVTKPTSHYSLKHYFHPECAYKLNIW